jgi:uncharacterized membrane protein YdjX (TVP38/TMEM64 family)
MGLVRRVLSSRALYMILGFSALAFVLLRWGDTLGGPMGLWERFGWLAVAVTVPLHALVAVTPFPSDVVAMTNGAIYGFWLGAALSWAGWFAASFIQYAIGRRAGRDFDIEGWLARSPSRLRRFPVAHPLFLIFSRFVPYVGGHLSTLVPGALAVPLRRFAWCTAVALVPQSLVMAGVGAGLLLL